MSNLAISGYDRFDSEMVGGDPDAPSGRHAFSEDAVLTPIFHALTRGGLRERRPEPVRARPAPASARAVPALDPVETFRRDPLTAPIPVQALVAVPSQPWRGGHEPEPRSSYRGSGRRRLRTGRHHRRLEVVGSSQPW